MIFLKKCWYRVSFFLVYRIFKHGMMMELYKQNMAGAFRINFDVFVDLVRNDIMCWKMGEDLNTIPPVYFIDCGDKIIFISSYSITRKTFNLGVVSRILGNSTRSLGKKGIMMLIVNSEKNGYRNINYGLYEEVKAKDTNFSLGEIIGIAKAAL